MYKYSTAYDQRGASMGRANHITDTEWEGKTHLELVPINLGGYDPGGAYWGLGEPLFVAYFDGEEEENEFFCRAQNRAEAKKEIRKHFPKIKFYH